MAATARLAVRERPVITVKPQAHLQQPAGAEPITLECLVTGTPKPSLFWTVEKPGREGNEMILPGMRLDNMYVTSEGALKIEEPRVENSGHYVCTAMNVVGSALARSHLVIYSSGQPTRQQEEIYRQESSSLQSQARLALLEPSIRKLEVIALGQESAKVTWRLANDNEFVQGFRLLYRQVRLDRYEDWSVVNLNHAEANSYVIRDLDEYVEYEVFVQPYYGSVVGLPSRLARIRTHQRLPAVAPVILNAKMVNASAAFIKWGKLREEEMSGPLLGYQVGFDEHYHLSVIRVPASQVFGNVREYILMAQSLNQDSFPCLSFPKSIPKCSFKDAKLVLFTFVPIPVCTAPQTRNKKCRFHRQIGL